MCVFELQQVRAPPVRFPPGGKFGGIQHTPPSPDPANTHQLTSQSPTTKSLTSTIFTTSPSPRRLFLLVPHALLQFWSPRMRAGGAIGEIHRVPVSSLHFDVTETLVEHSIAEGPNFKDSDDEVFDCRVRDLVGATSGFMACLPFGADQVLGGNRVSMYPSAVTTLRPRK